MKKFVAVIGSRNSGKSTIIKSLTGCPRSNTRVKIYDLVTGNTIYVCASSPQEQEPTQEALNSILTEASEDEHCLGVVMAIQPTLPRKRLSMEDILDAVNTEGGYEISSFVIDPGRDAPGADYSSIQTRLEKYEIKPTKLDGRRFALHNANKINNTIRLL